MEWSLLPSPPPPSPIPTPFVTLVPSNWGCRRIVCSPTMCVCPLWNEHVCATCLILFLRPAWPWLFTVLGRGLDKVSKYGPLWFHAFRLCEKLEAQYLSKTCVACESLRLGRTSCHTCAVNLILFGLSRVCCHVDRRNLLVGLCSVCGLSWHLQQPLSFRLSPSLEQSCARFELLPLLACLLACLLLLSSLLVVASLSIPSAEARNCPYHLVVRWLLTD